MDSLPSRILSSYRAPLVRLAAAIDAAFQKSLTPERLAAALARHLAPPDIEHALNWCTQASLNWQYLTVADEASPFNDAEAAAPSAAHALGALLDLVDFSVTTIDSVVSYPKYCGLFRGETEFGWWGPLDLTAKQGAREERIEKSLQGLRYVCDLSAFIPRLTALGLTRVRLQDEVPIPMCGALLVPSPQSLARVLKETLAQRCALEVPLHASQELLAAMLGLPSWQHVLAAYHRSGDANPVVLGFPQEEEKLYASYAAGLGAFIDKVRPWQQSDDACEVTILQGATLRQATLNLEARSSTRPGVVVSLRTLPTLPVSSARLAQAHRLLKAADLQQELLAFYAPRAERLKSNEREVAQARRRLEAADVAPEPSAVKTGQDQPYEPCDLLTLKDWIFLLTNFDDRHSVEGSVLEVLCPQGARYRLYHDSIEMVPVQGSAAQYAIAGDRADQHGERVSIALLGLSVAEVRELALFASSVFGGRVPAELAA
jgi:hypothetical protein